MRRLEDHKDLAGALALESERREGRAIPASCYRPQALFYSERVRYLEQLRRYHAVFPREQVLVLIYDDFRADNAGTVRTVLEFLGVDQDAVLPAVEANPSVAVRSLRLDAFRHRLGGGAKASQGSGEAQPTLGGRARRLAGRAARRALYERPPEPDERLMRELRGNLEEEVRSLGEYLDRDLITLWGYDRVE